ncbi:MAG: 2-oxoacid:acceptor oxidoreductase family protein [Deltaproteobacteria bacterium]|nr:2-oxoacid:acceptor oxidoreductase family protein [Deltaproteobacteria bacterium]
MFDNISIKKSQAEFFQKNDITEFPCFCIARQGGRTAMEILTRALIMEGRYAYLGQNLTGLRSMGTNSFVIRFGESPEIPPGISLNNPKGILIMHDAMLSAKKGVDSFLTQLSPQDAMAQLKTGILMVSTAKAPEELSYPFSFEGTVATVDAEAVFSKRLGIQPAPSGIATLGLFAAATDNLLSLDTLKEAVMAHERLDIKVREANVLCLEDAFHQTKVVHNMKFEAPEQEAVDLQKIERRSISTKWRRKLPVCNTAKCNCAGCASAYYCPEAAISWKDENMDINYDVCKACGTCMVECVRDAITMEDAEKTTSLQKQQGEY